MKQIGKQIAAAAVSLALAGSLAVSAQVPSGSQPAASSKSSSSQPQERKMHGCCRGGEMKTLSGITGMSVEELMAKYPQKTAWQIAKSLGKLDALKSSFLSEQKNRLAQLEKDGKITAKESQKIYQDLQKRVAAIDGTHTVILGRPGFRPQFRQENAQGR